jgi:hypothetical protein
VCFLVLSIDPSREQNPATDEDCTTSNNCRKTRSRIGKHGSLRMPVRSLVNSSVTAEKGPTAIAVVPRHRCLSRGAFRCEPLTSHAMELSLNGDRDGLDLNEPLLVSQRHHRIDLHRPLRRHKAGQQRDCPQQHGDQGEGQRVGWLDPEKHA